MSNLKTIAALVFLTLTVANIIFYILKGKEDVRKSFVCMIIAMLLVLAIIVFHFLSIIYEFE